MAREGGRRFWRTSRRVFRWCRITLLAFVLLAVLALLYLNKVGLPSFVKKRVVAAIEAEGLDIEFSRLRLKGYRQLIIDQVRLGATNSPTPVEFTAAQAQLGFQREALKSFTLKLDAIDLDRGNLAIVLKNTNAANRTIEVQDIKAQLRRQTGDRWTIESVRGESLGAHWQLSGSLTNIFALNSPKTKNAKTNDWTPVLQNFLDTLDRIQFASPPRISITALGDLNELALFKASVSLRSDSAKTPWGDADELFIRTAVAPSDKPGQEMEASLNLELKRAATPWGGLNGAAILAHTIYPLTNNAVFKTVWDLRANEITGKWVSARNVKIELNTSARQGTNLLTVVDANAVRGRLPVGEASEAHFHARVEHAYPLAALNSFLINLLPVKPAVFVPDVPESEILTLGQHWKGDWQLNFDNLKTERGAARKFAISGDVRERPDSVASDASWGFWQNIASLLANYHAEATDFITPEARIDKVIATGQWRAPQLTISGIDSQLYGGSFHLDAALDVVSRHVEGKTQFDFDLQKTASIFDPEVRPFLAQFTWEKPPRVDAAVSLTLPPWTNSIANSRDEIFRSAVLNGSLAIGPAAFRGVTCSEASTHFTLTNFQWRLPDLQLKRPEGQLTIDYTGHAFEPQFRLALRGGVNPWAALPLLSEDAQEAIKFAEFPQPPYIEGVLTGNLDKLETLRFEGAIAATNAIVRNEPFLDLKSGVAYSNNWIYFTEPIAHRTTNEVVTASAAAIDLKKLVMHLTNGFSTTDPYRFTKVIGPITYNAIAPYIFHSNPTVRANGVIPLADADDADIQFQISGEDFSYWRFNMSKVSGGVYWHHQYLEVTNITANFYGGHLDWEGHFHFLTDDTADYSFKGITTNADFAQLLHDLLPEATNKLEGTINGTLIITEANSTNITTWKGHGEGELKNGFLWDIPIFGVLSKPLDAIAPGFGKSKISSGAGTFQVDGGKVYTKDMEVRAPAFRLKYDGTVDFDGNLDAKVEAQLFRDAWVFGRAVSAVFWPLAKVFESKISGNLAAPKSELAHIPKIMLFPLRPIQTIKELIPKDKEKEKEKEK